MIKMQKATFLLVAFATAAVVSITVGAAGKYVNLNDWGKKHVFITLLGVQTGLLLFLFFCLQNIYIYGFALEIEVFHQ